MQALRAILAGENRATSLRLLDLFPVSIRYESSSDKEGLRSAVDCAALEGPLPRLVDVAAGSARALGSGVDEEGLKRLLGLLDLKLDRVITRLSSKPTRRRNKFSVLGLDHALGRESGLVVDEEPDPDLGMDLYVATSLDPGLDLGLDPSLDSDLDMGLDPGLDLASEIKPSLIS